MTRYRLTRRDTDEYREFELELGQLPDYEALRFTAGNIPCYTGPQPSSRAKLDAAITQGQPLTLPNWTLEVLE